MLNSEVPLYRGGVVLQREAHTHSNIAVMIYLLKKNVKNTATTHRLKSLKSLPLLIAPPRQVGGARTVRPLECGHGVP